MVGIVTRTTTVREIKRYAPTNRLTNKYAGKITYFSDSIRLEGNDKTTASLHRFTESNIPFNFIPEEKDSLLFASYLEGFDKRLVREFEKAGIKISEGMEKPALPAYEELLQRKDQNQ